MDCTFWNNAGFNLCVAVNLFVCSFCDFGLFGWISHMLVDVAFLLNRLIFEIIEGMVMYDLVCAVTMLCQLFDIGIIFLFDDFGIGYFSLFYF